MSTRVFQEAEIQIQYNNETTTDDCVQDADNAVLHAEIEMSEIREAVKQIKNKVSWTG